MADDDKFITTRFTKNEMKIIETSMEKNKIKNPSQFVRQAIEDKLHITLADSGKNPQTLPKEYLTLLQFYEELKKKIVPKIHPKLDEFFLKWKSDHWHDWIDEDNEKLWHVDKIWPEFREHVKVGRPKKERIRGRPKRT